MTKFGTSSRGYENKTMISNPGPGTYTLDGQIGRNAPKFSLSPKRNETVKRIKKNPGPGAYDPNSSFIDKALPNIKFPKGTRASVDIKKTKNLPGPLDYSPKFVTSKKRNSPAFGFGTSRRPDPTKAKGNPGPGNYTIPSIRDGPGFKMGIRVRDKNSNTDSPSPGTYNPNDGYTK